MALFDDFSFDAIVDWGSDILDDVSWSDVIDVGSTAFQTYQDFSQPAMSKRPT